MSSKLGVRNRSTARMGECMRVRVGVRPQARAVMQFYLWLGNKVVRAMSRVWVNAKMELGE